jgi:aldehyde:ferredoxin oxidoreductase
MAEFGYAGEILKIDLSNIRITRFPTAPYTEKFLGGRGLAARLYWEMARPEAEAFEPENCLIFATGPVTGFAGLAGCRWQACGKAPIMAPEAFSYANLGERWGPYLKYSGFDSLLVQGKADHPVYAYIHDGAVEIKDAASLWGKTTFETIGSLKTELGKNVSILTIGPAAENRVVFATLFTDDGASGAGGLGSVMGSKNLKAIVVAPSKNRPKAAHPDQLKTLIKRISVLRKDTWKDWLDDVPGLTEPRACYGCGIGCFRKSYKNNGKRYKFFCQATHVYWNFTEQYGGDSTAVALQAIRLCDQYGLDTTVMQPMIAWLEQCYKQGVLGETETGLPLSRIGSTEFIQELTRKIAIREGFGDILAQGTLKTAEMAGKQALELTHASVLTRASETRDYDPRLVLTNALLYATEQRRPINQVHELTHALWLWLNRINGEQGAFLSTDDFLNVAKNFWGGIPAADFSTYEGKALAAKKIQDRTYSKESLILCDFLWPVIWVRFADDHTGDPTLESQVFTAVTGREMDEAGLSEIGERVFNLQRAIFLRQGWGGRQGDRLLDYLHDEPLDAVFFNPDCIVPGKDGEPFSRKGLRIERSDFENLKSEYYALRGWDVNSGLLKEAKLTELGLSDIAVDLKEKDLLK